MVYVPCVYMYCYLSVFILYIYTVPVCMGFLKPSKVTNWNMNIIFNFQPITLYGVLRLSLLTYTRSSSSI